jgi:predicted AAA+ superfamily ATPase
MYAVSEKDIAERIARDNPWWEDGAASIREDTFYHRVYFEKFISLALDFSVKRAPILLGPRRVGKTFMAKQTIARAITTGFPQKNILYASIDTPLYAGIPLEKLLRFLPNLDTEQCIVIFDEIQYLKDWEIHLKDLVDSYPNIKFIATGSAAATLRLKSKESGAGRFTDFLMPPLTFHEYLCLVGLDDELILKKKIEGKGEFFQTNNIDTLNSEFINYLNYGGYPEVVVNPNIRSNADQFVKNDIIDKVLLKDLPSLYGINEIQELNRLFTIIAYNTGGEVSIQNISQQSGLAKQTIKKYIEYLESAFLVIRLPTVDENCKSPKRIHNFKLYLSNPSMRAALFSPVKPDETEKIGHLAEAAILSQWQHSSAFSETLRYARWKNGEVDIVCLGSDQRPAWIGEVKWSDKTKNKFSETAKNSRKFMSKHKEIEDIFFTSKTHSFRGELDGKTLRIIPSALYCYTVGRNITESLKHAPDYEFEDLDDDEFLEDDESD